VEKYFLITRGCPEERGQKERRMGTLWPQHVADPQNIEGKKYLLNNISL
jgi:hypothetical protein